MACGLRVSSKSYDNLVIPAIVIDHRFANHPFVPRNLVGHLHETFILEFTLTI